MACFIKTRGGYQLLLNRNDRLTGSQHAFLQLKGVLAPQDFARKATPFSFALNEHAAKHFSALVVL